MQISNLKYLLTSQYLFNANRHGKKNRNRTEIPETGTRPRPSNIRTVPIFIYPNGSYIYISEPSQNRTKNQTCTLIYNTINYIYI